MIDEMPQSTQRRPAMTEHQEIRKFTGEALRVRIPWNQHPAWSVVAERHGEEARKPPPALTDADIRAMICGSSQPALQCPNCGHVMVETR